GADVEAGPRARAVFPGRGRAAGCRGRRYRGRRRGLAGNRTPGGSRQTRARRAAALRPGDRSAGTGRPARRGGRRRSPHGGHLRVIVCTAIAPHLHPVTVGKDTLGAEYLALSAAQVWRAIDVSARPPMRRVVATVLAEHSPDESRGGGARHASDIAVGAHAAGRDARDHASDALVQLLIHAVSLGPTADLPRGEPEPDGRPGAHPECAPNSVGPAWFH